MKYLLLWVISYVIASISGKLVVDDVYKFVSNDKNESVCEVLRVYEVPHGQSSFRYLHETDMGHDIAPMELQLKKSLHAGDKVSIETYTFNGTTLVESVYDEYGRELYHMTYHTIFQHMLVSLLVFAILCVIKYRYEKSVLSMSDEFSV